MTRRRTLRTSLPDMRRPTLLATVVAVLACVFAAVAVAATPRTGTYRAAKGGVQKGKDLSFVVDQGGRRIRTLVAHVQERCGGGTPDITTAGPGFTWTVKGGRFSGKRTVKGGNLTLITTLTGRFTSRTTAVGTLRQQSQVGAVTCDTGVLKFTARRR